MEILFQRVQTLMHTCRSTYLSPTSKPKFEEVSFALLGGWFLKLLLLQSNIKEYN